MKKFKTVREELLYLNKKYKRLVNPHEVVTYAENPETKLHSKFEWDDEKAGHEYRIWQARQIISLELTVIENNGVLSEPVRLFVSLKNDRNKKGGYRLITDVLDDKNMRLRLLSEAFADFDRIKERYNALTELAEIFTAIDKAKTRILEPVEIE